MKSHRMQDMTFPEVREYLKTNRTIIIPYALREQHGAHLPLDVDLRNAEFCSAKLAEALDCLVAPVLSYTFSGGMLPGTINVKPNTFSNLVGEIIESLALQGFENHQAAFPGLLQQAGSGAGRDRDCRRDHVRRRVAFWPLGRRPPPRNDPADACRHRCPAPLLKDGMAVPSPVKKPS